MLNKLLIGFCKVQSVKGTSHNLVTELLFLLITITNLYKSGSS